MADDKGTPFDISDAISKLMANPQIIQTVASALGGDTGNTADNVNITEEGNRENSPSQSTADLPVGELLPMISKLSSVGNLAALSKNSSSPSQSNSICLLQALKPYMNSKRRDAIDKLVKFSGFSDILKKL